MSIEHRYPELIADIEAAAPQPLYWSEALKAISRHVGDAAVGLILEYPDGVGPPFGSAAHFDSKKMIEWGERFYDADPWTQAGCFPLPGEVVFCPTPEQEIERTTYYQEWMKPQGFQPGSMIAGCLSGNPRSASQSIGFYSRLEGRRLTEADRRFILELLPHLQQAAAVSRRVLGLDPPVRPHAETLALVRIPILHLDAARTIRWANPEMEDLLQEGDGPRRSGNHLVFANPSDERRFREILAELRSEEFAGVQREMLVQREQGGHPDRITVYRSRNAQPRDPAFPIYLVFCTTRSLGAEGDDAYLVRTYGLNHSEARLAIELLAGASSRDAAAALSLTHETVRQYIKRIFRKTHTNSQSELMRVLVRDLTSTPRRDNKARQADPLRGPAHSRSKSKRSK